MTDTMRTRLNLILTAAVAFGVGLAATAPFDLAQESVARGAATPLVMDVRQPTPRTNDGSTLTGFSEIAAQITPAVVTIEVQREVEISRRIPLPMDEQPLAPGSGSGFIISEDGYIVTNNHVVDGARSIEVLLADGRRFDNVELVGRDATTDVALLKIDAPDLVHAPIGSSEASRVGDWVLAIGSPGFGGGAPSSLMTTVTAGIISAKGRSINILNRQFSGPASPAIEDFIQTDAAINPGNSGGPLVNANGEVIGINTAIASVTGTYQGYGFAVPMDLVREVVDDLVEFGTVRRAILGVTVQEVDDADARFYGLERVGGALIRSVGEGSPAEEAGLEAGDVIVQVAGRQVTSVSDLQREVRSYEPGDIVTVEYVGRDGERESRRITLISADAAETITSPRAEREVTVNASDPLGIRVQEVDGEIRRAFNLPRGIDGVVVADVDWNGPLARRSGRLFRDPQARLPGLSITEVTRREIESVEDYEDAVEDVEPGDVVGLMLYDPRQQGEGGSPRAPLTVPIPSR